MEENEGKKSIDFERDEINKLMSGDCIEKEINGEKLIVCGQKISIDAEHKEE